MHPAFPRRLVILGGGSAGWMAAAYLDRTFNLPGRQRLPITLVESAATGRIGVGEATVPTLGNFCRFLGIGEAVLMQRTKATLKQGVRFVNWDERGGSYFHPFEALENIGANAGPPWLARRAGGHAAPFELEMGVQARLALADLSPKHVMDSDYGARLPYAYHLDAEAFGDLLQEVASARGVERIEGDVVAAEQDHDGDITALMLADGRRVEGDLFVDCSGFAQVLIGRTLGVPFLSYADSLLCDRAVAIPVPRPAGRAIHPYTQAIAQDAGWIWRIGLQDREGTGHVYSSAFIDDDAAEATLRAAVGADADLPARRLEMRVGRPETIWHRNVVALGLAGGFVEPLESTGLHMVEWALELLVRYFPMSGINPAARDRFNRRLGTAFDELRDFIAAHYVASPRRDTPFWRAATDPARRSTELAALLELWRDRHPAPEDLGISPRLFGAANWQAVLYGMGHVGEAALANADRWVPDRDALSAQVDQAATRLEADLPGHTIWLAALASLTPPAPSW